MLDLVLTIVFSIVMLFFMLFPAMKTTELVNRWIPIPQRYYTPMTIIIDILLSLAVGLFLKL